MHRYSPLGWRELSFALSGLIAQPKREWGGIGTQPGPKPSGTRPHFVRSELDYQMVFVAVQLLGM